MRTYIGSVLAAALLAGTALAQMGPASNVYLLDVDPARYAGPAGQRLALRVDDAPRHVSLNDTDEICVQLERLNPDVISARVRVLRPEPHAAVAVRLVAPDISPGTFRSTPWGLLLRVVPESSAAVQRVKAVGMRDAPVCVL